MTHNQFLTKYQYGRVDVDRFPKYYEYQCVDLVWLYITQVHGKRWRILRGNGGAKNAFTDYPNSFIYPEDYELIVNDWNDVNQIPRQGDIMIWNEWAGNPWGHIAIVHQAFPGQNWWIAFEQNAGGGSGQGRGQDAAILRGHKYTAFGGYGKISGWLRKK